MPETQPNNAPRSATFVIRVVVAALVVVVLGFAAFILMTPREGPRAALIGGPFTLQDGDGKTISDQTLRGRPFLVYFGYTHCPDVCPTELAKISDILGKMGDKPVPALFITVDPERDTPKLMQDYVSSFNPAIVGLSGSPKAVQATEKTFRVFARKGEKQPDGDYSMDHSSVVYLMDKNGAFVEAFNVERPPEDAAKELEKYL
ncbi:MAG: SCO family protein [Hyphomicrobiales bacterium]|nr:SCO family protein [Hyphomicrobiales bacterium]MBV9910676.1 SCO family protein [Hyphomicrobiales bacterium]